MLMNPSPHFDFSSLFPPNDGTSLAAHSPQHNCPVSPSSLDFNFPSSKLDDSPAFSGKHPSIFTFEESNEDAPKSEESPCLGWGSASTLKETPNSKHGQDLCPKLGETRERGMNKSGHTVYKGVRKRKGDRWVSEIREPGKKSRIWLGTFPTPEMAASAYDVAAFNLKRPFAYLNFPEHVSSLPILSLPSPKGIQEAAASVAALRGLASSSNISSSGGLVATPTPRVDATPTSSSTEQQKQSTTVETKASSLIDEDMIFDMPNVLAHMAEGLMIEPPLQYLATATDAYDNTACDHIESFLWNL